MNIKDIKTVTVAKSDETSPRNDTANVLKLRNGNLMLVWHKYSNSAEGGSDFGICRICSKVSRDGGYTWEDERVIVDVCEGDLNVQAPALCMMPDGKILLICVRAHANNSSSMIFLESVDDGISFREVNKVWERSKGQWLQGGGTSLLHLKGGRLLIPYHGGDGTQMSQHNKESCFISDDMGKTWIKSKGEIDLPMRGAMEGSVAELSDGTLVMSLRTQLGAVFLSYSFDAGDSWTMAQTTGLKSGESCTCLRKFPDSDDLLLVWNDSEYIPNHHHYGARSPLSLAISHDRGESWERLGDIETGNFEYTNLNCTFIDDRQAVITYMKIADYALKDGKVVDLKIPFLRKGMDLMADIVTFE